MAIFCRLLANYRISIGTDPHTQCDLLMPNLLRRPKLEDRRLFLGPFVRLILAWGKISDKSVARFLGLSRGGWSQITRGNRPISYHRLIALAKLTSAESPEILLNSCEDSRVAASFIFWTSGNGPSHLLQQLNQGNDCSTSS
jgi:transcriptional regulator with XRE-family HTH domain